MGESGGQPGGFAGPDAALAAVQAGLGFLAGADAASMPADTLAGCLRALERAGSVHTAARARLLAAFNARAVFEDDGHGSAKTWLAWQTRITRGAARGAVGWVRRLAAHPRVAGALAAAELSESWAREVCGWSDRLPPDLRADADQILLAAAAGGAGLADLRALAEEMFRRSAPPDTDDDDGFPDRSLQLDVHFRGAGKLAGDLTPECTAALTAVLESLGKRAGPEDDRNKGQRDHDALEEACRRLIAGGCLPEYAGQPTQVQLHLTLDQLRSLNGAPDAEAAWLAARGAGDGEPGWLAGRAAAEAYACDAAITPIVTGHLDRAVLADLTAGFLAGWRQPACTCGGCTCLPRPAATPQGPAQPGAAPAGPAPAGPAPAGPAPAAAAPAGTGTASSGPAGAGPGGPLPPETPARLQDTLLRAAADVLSGPAGLAAFLRTGLLAAEFPSVSLPLDAGTATSTVPPHLRRAVIARDRHCAFPGCQQRPAACHSHHLIPRSRGGPTALHNLILACAFHHLIAIHRWGWTIALNGDGTTTATSPDGQRVLHSHSPPAGAAA
jgi:hypothetical protein